MPYFTTASRGHQMFASYLTGPVKLLTLNIDFDGLQAMNPVAGYHEENTGNEGQFVSAPPCSFDMFL